MAKKPRTPEEQRRIDERIAFVQAHPELSKEEARTRFYVQTRAAELEAQGKEVDRKALRQKFQMGGVTREGFYTPGDVQAAARRRAALNATRTGETGTTGQTGQTGGVTSPTPPAEVKAPDTGPLGGTNMVRGVPTRMGPETKSWTGPKPAAKEAEKITPWQETWPNKQINAAINKVDRVVTGTGKFAYNTLVDTGESFNATFVNPAINVVGGLVGKNPNLRVAGPVEATTNVAGLLLDIFTFGGSSAARTGLTAVGREAAPGLVRTAGRAITELFARPSTARMTGEVFAGVSGRQVVKEAGTLAAEAGSKVVKGAVEKIPGGAKVKAATGKAVSKIEEFVTPYEYRALREGAATAKPAKAGTRGSWQGTRAGRIRATEEIDAADILDFEPENAADLFPSGRYGNIVSEEGDDAFNRIGFDVEETTEAPRYSADVTPADVEEASKVDEWMRGTPAPQPRTTPPPAQTTQVVPEARAPRAPEPQTQRTTPPPAQTTPPPTAPPAASTRPVLQLGPDRPEPTTEVGKSLKALFQDITEGVQETTAQIPTPTPRPPAAAAPEGDLGSLFGPEFQARRQAADEAARRAAERSPNSRAARQNPELRTPTRRADLTPEELEARKVETRAKDAERKRLERAKKAEQRKAAKEAAQKAADEAAQQAPTSGATNVLSETEQAREAAGTSNTPSWFTAKRERQAQRAAEAAAAPEPQAAQEVVVSAREAVTEATQIPESQMTSEQWWANAGGTGQAAPAPTPAPSPVPEAPSAPVRQAPVEPTRAVDTGTRGTGRSRPVTQPPASSATKPPAPPAAPTTVAKPMDLSKITTQEQFDEFMKQGGRQLFETMDVADLVQTIKTNPSLQGFLEKNPIRATTPASGTKVPGQMKAVSNEGTQTRFNRRGVAVPEELSRPMTFEPPVKPTSMKERTELQKTIDALENQRKRLMELTDLRGGARTEVESSNIDALQRQIDESRRVMLEFNQEYIAGVAPKAKPMSAAEEARLSRMAKQKAKGKPVSETVDEGLPGLSSDVESQMMEVEARGTQRRTADPDWEREVNPDDIDLFDEPSY